MRLLEIIAENPLLVECLRRLPDLELRDWYLGAGCVAQTVWNMAHGAPAHEGIRDYDFAYFDTELSATAEALVEERVRRLLANLPLTLDVKNQARVHLWYQGKFGYAVRPYGSTEEAIATWPTTATAIGLRSGGDNLQICAPFGTRDLLELVVRPNRVQITPEIYAAKVARWAHRWPSLVVLPWEEGVGTPQARWVR